LTLFGGIFDVLQTGEIQMKAKLLILLLLPFFLVGCATPVTHHTQSGRVEVTINGVKKSAVKETLINDMVNRRYTVTRADDTLVVFERPVENVMAAALLGSQFNAVPVTRCTYNLIQNGKDVRVIGDFAVITNPGSAFERRTDMNSHPETVLMQDFMEQMKSKLERNRKAGK
jgi:hypothetical protein